MSAFASFVGADIHSRFLLLSSPITSVQELLSRDSVQVANEMRISIQELEVIKLRVTSKLLFAHNVSSHSSSTDMPDWKSLPFGLPVSSSEPNIIRPLGIPGLDTLLGGGIPSGCVCSIIGNTGTGKTYVSSYCAAACALLGMKVMLISSTNDMGLKRLQFAMENIMKINQNPNKPYNAAQVQEILLFALSNVHTQGCFDVWSLLDLLSKVKDQNTFDVVIIDSLHHFVAPLGLSTNSAGGNNTALSRGTTVAGTGAASAGANPVAGSVSAGTVSEFATSLLIQVGILLRSITAGCSSVLVTNTPAVLGLQRRNSTGGGVVRTASTASSGYSTYGGGGGIVNEASAGNGTGSALLDLVDISITLEKGEYDRSRSIRDLFNESGTAMSVGNNVASVPTVIKAVATLRPPYLKGLNNNCEFQIK